MHLLVFIIPLFLFPVMMIMMFVFPEQYTKLLLFLYDPLSRWSLILIVLLVYLYFKLRKKPKKHIYDFFHEGNIVSDTLHGLPYHYRVVTEKHSTQLIVYVDAICGYDFMLKFENSFERMLKSLSLAFECQSRDTLFDRTIYIVSDDVQVCHMLKSDEILRKNIFSLFWKLKEEGFHVRSLRFHEGRLVLDATTKDTGEEAEQQAQKAAKTSVSYMHALVQRVPKRQEKSSFVYREKTSRTLSIILAIFTALLLNGLLKLLLDSTSTFFLPRLLDKTDLLRFSLMATVAALMLYTTFVLIYFYKSSRLPQALFAGFTLGAAGLFLSALTTIKELDIYLDDSPSVTKRYTILNSYITRGRYTSYHIVLSEIGDIKVPYGIYKRVHTGSDVIVDIKRGYLNIPWIRSIQKATS